LKYSRTAIALHWLMAAGLVANFTLGVSMADLPLSPQKLRMLSWHKWAGVTLFMLVALRLAWRLGHRPPALPPMPGWQARASRWGHVMLYVLMFAIPLSGWAMSSAAGIPVVYLGLVELPMPLEKNRVLMEVLRDVHLGLNASLALLVTGHVTMALKHHFIDADGLLARMGLGWRA
jgi:cytochrome b561